MLTLMLLPFPPLSTPSSDISNNSFYCPINSNFRSMIPDNGVLLNIAGNFFYGDPMLYADGCQFCPSQITQSHRLDRACVPPQAGAAEARFTCECDDGFVPTNGTLGSTCARPAPPPAAGAGVASLRHENDPLTPFLLHENVSFNSLFSSPLAPLYPPVRQVRAMASLRHEHMVRLLGFCLHQNVESGQQEQILVYEFVPNGDL
ncbi:unnamed protein product [Closterium sp. NIES-65]|nr:unnamed protein product [Closterium sp. NIES-65]